MTTTQGVRRGGRILALLGDDGVFGRSLALIVLVSAWVATWRPMVDPDFGWHLRIGERVLDGSGLPRTDVFSWLTAGQPFVAHSWAWDVLLAGVFRAGGLMGTSLLALPVSAAAVALTWYLIGLTAPSVPPFPRSVLVAVGIVIGLPIWSPRAQIWDVVLVLACVALWSRWLRRGDVRALVAVPIVPFLWVNLHGGSALAFIACLLALAVAIPIGVRWGTWPRRPIRPLVISTLVALAAYVINPYGVEILGLAGNGQVGNAFLPAIAEWQPPAFGEVGFGALRIVLAAGILVAFGLRGRRRDPFLLLLAAGWTFLALGAARFSIVAGPLLVIALAPGFGGSLRAWFGVAGGAPVGTGDAVGAASRGAPPRAFFIAAAGVAGLIAVAGVLQIAPARQSAKAADTFPVAALSALVDAGCHGRILNAYDWGGYLIAGWTEPVATYGSSPKDLVGVEAQLERVEIDPRPFLDGQAVQLVLMPTGGPLDRWLDEADDWQVWHRDTQATIHLRLGSSGCPAVAAAAQAGTGPAPQAGTRP